MATKSTKKAKKAPAKPRDRKPAKNTGKASKRPGRVVMRLPAAKDTAASTAFVPGKEPLIPGGFRGELRDVPLGDIKNPAGASDRMPGPEDAKEIADLAGSMAAVGQLQPVLVEETPNGLVRVFGRRRIAAAKELGWKTIRAVVCGALSPAARRVVVAVENVQRKNLTPVEESLGVAELLDLQALEAARQIGKPLDVMGGLDTHGPAVHGKVITREIIAELEANPAARKAWAHDVMLDPRVRARACEIVAAQLAKDATWVRDRMYLARLDDDARELVRQGKLPLMHAREIARVGDPERRAELAKDYAAGGSDSISDHEAGKFEDLRQEVGTTLFRLTTVPWRLEVPIGDKRPCVGCPHNSTSQPGLFDGGGIASSEMFGGAGRDTRKVVPADEEKGVCTNGSCYHVKLRITKAAAADAAKKVVDAKGAVPALAKEICRPAVITNKIADRRKQVGSRSSSRSRGARVVERDPNAVADAKRQEQINVAKQHLAQAYRERVSRFEPEIAKRLNAKPGLWAAFAILRRTKAYEATQHYDTEKAVKACKHPVLVNAVGLLAGDPSAAILQFEQLCGRNFGVLDKYKDGHTGFLDLVAGVLGVDVGKPPMLEDFLPSAHKEEAAGEKKGKGGRRSRRKDDAQAEAAAANGDDAEQVGEGDDSEPEGTDAEGGDE
jgi:ParB-like chromosome segregation protein Spo0J